MLTTPETKWKETVRAYSVEIKGQTYLSMKGVGKLEALFLSDLARVIRANPDLIADKLDVWQGMTNDMIEKLLEFSEVLETSTEIAQRAREIQYGSEL